jgi:hypothetical protein
MARGGRRRGTPGKAYSNRNDLMQGYNPTTGLTTPAAGGQAAPSAPAQSLSSEPPQRAFTTPDQTPSISDPTGRPNEPLTAGLPSGPGPGPTPDPRPQEAVALKQYLPILDTIITAPDAPESVRRLYRYIDSI